MPVVCHTVSVQWMADTCEADRYICVANQLEWPLANT